MKEDGRKHNGGHSTAGRKKATDPKRKIELWIENSIIEKNGGVCETKEKLLKFIKVLVYEQ